MREAGDDFEAVAVHCKGCAFPGFGSLSRTH
jgi:hypothetical protein